jgi:hypothetical protein
MSKLAIIATTLLAVFGDGHPPHSRLSQLLNDRLWRKADTRRDADACQVPIAGMIENAI